MIAKRRSNEERSAETRERLLDATIECLVKHGYGGATTTEISKVAGVSRGAQLHHFPLKSELVGASVEHLFNRRQEEFRAAFTSLPEGTDKISGAIDLMWSMLCGPTFYAWLELVVASRADEALRERLYSVCLQFDQDVQQLVRDLFSPPEELFTVLHAAGHLLFASLEGLATSQIVYGDQRPCGEILAILKHIIHQATAPFSQGAPA